LRLFTNTHASIVMASPFAKSSGLFAPGSFTRMNSPLPLKPAAALSGSNSGNCSLGCARWPTATLPSTVPLSSAAFAPGAELSAVVLVSLSRQ
jgi:hypothetical protein